MAIARTSLRPLDRPTASGGRSRLQIWQLVTLYRIAALVVAGAVLLSQGTAASDVARTSWLAFAALVVGATVMHRLSNRVPTALLITIETALAAMLLALAPAEASVLALYLLVPAFWAGVALRPVATLITVIGGSAIAIAIQVATGTWTQDVAPSHWIGLTLVAALLGAWSARLHRRSTDDAADYERTLVLLRQLEAITRRLPAGLDRLAALHQIVESVREVRPDADVWIYGAVPGTGMPEFGTAGDVSLIATPGSREWLHAINSRKPMTIRGDDGADSLALVPMVNRESVIGVVRIATPKSLTKPELRALQQGLAVAPLQLLASRAFDQIRESAIAEERSRVSRQIHDGVAQDLAGLAYVLDGLAYEAEAPGEREILVQSSAEVRRLVEELRYSIFDLRTGMGAEQRFGTALATYVHEVGERAGMRVQVEIDEGASGVPSHTAHELFRIAQEAITNARRHARARSLWVVLRVNADGLLLRVADDGAGIHPRDGRRVGDGVGLSIMSERAERLGGRLAVRARSGGGTVVECRVQAEPNAGNPRAARVTPATPHLQAPQGPPVAATA